MFGPPRAFVALTTPTTLSQSCPHSSERGAAYASWQMGHARAASSAARAADAAGPAAAQSDGLAIGRWRSGRPGWPRRAVAPAMVSLSLPPMFFLGPFSFRTRRGVRVYALASIAPGAAAAWALSGRRCGDR